MTRVLQDFQLCQKHFIGNTAISLPEDVLILDAYLNHDYVHLIMIVNPSFPTVPRRFHIARLWVEIPNNLRFISSIFLANEHFSTFIFEYMDNQPKEETTES